MTLNKSEMNEHIIQTTKELSAHCKEKYDLGKNWNIHLTFDYSSYRKNQYGGTIIENNKVYPAINLALNDIQHYKIKGFREYHHYHDDKVIGNIRTTDWKIYLKCLIAHEISHCVQWYFPHSSSYLKINDYTYKNMPAYEVNHKQFFQTIYSDLRIKYVNHHLSPNDIGVVVNSNYGSKIEPIRSKIVI